MQISKKLKDFLKISLRYKSENYFNLQKRKKIISNLYPFRANFSQMADQGKRTKETTGESIPENQLSQKIGGIFKPTQNPSYIAERIKIYDDLIKEQKKVYENANKRPIQITLKDGKVIEGKSFETSAWEIARKISKKLAESIVVAKVTYSKKDPNPLETCF